MPSSVVLHRSYDPESRILRIIYTSGSIYDYFDVPPEVFEEMNKAFSKGVFLNTEVKNKYRYFKIR